MSAVVRRLLQHQKNPVQVGQEKVKREAIPVTKPFLPPREDYQRLIDQVWARNWLTNDGPLVKRLESHLEEYLNLEGLLFVSSGTMALQLAMKALGLTGDVITTPFSYVATTSSIVWEGCRPVFVDIDPKTLNIDPNKIEKAVTPSTSAIVATHCFGNPCEIDTIRAIADAHNLKVIYDAAHCFGTTYRGRSVFEYGDISATSFHATKIYHTVEGGSVVTQDAELSERLAYMRNFGHDGPGEFNGVGINGKNSEMHAAMGLCNLKYIKSIMKRRAEQCAYYDELLSGLNLRRPIISEGGSPNYAYYPVLFSSHGVMKRAIHALNQKSISPRRYFHPSLSSLGYVPKASTPVSDDVARRVLCLPLYHDLTKKSQKLIAQLVSDVI